MKSLKIEPFINPLAEGQDQYNTLYFAADFADPMLPMHVYFQFNPAEIAEINRNGGRVYYTQNVFYKINNLELIPGQFHPMRISPFSPLEPLPDHAANYEAWERGELVKTDIIPEDKEDPMSNSVTLEVVKNELLQLKEDLKKEIEKYEQRAKSSGGALDTDWHYAIAKKQAYWNISVRVDAVLSNFKKEN